MSNSDKEWYPVRAKPRIFRYHSLSRIILLCHSILEMDADLPLMQDCLFVRSDFLCTCYLHIYQSIPTFADQLEMYWMTSGE